MPAYKRLRADGLQPPSVDGAAELERKATEPIQVTMGTPNADPKKVREGVAMSKDFGLVS